MAFETRQSQDCVVLTAGSTPRSVASRLLALSGVDRGRGGVALFPSTNGNEMEEDEVRATPYTRSIIYTSLWLPTLLLSCLPRRSFGP